MDNAFRIGRGHAGLSFTDPKDYTAPPWNSWETFRCGAVGVDFGSEGVAHARSRQLKLAVERLRDQSHINNRVAHNALQEIELYPLATRWLVGWSLLRGPDKEDTRWRPLRGGLGDMCARSKWSDVPRFSSMAPLSFGAADGRRRRARRTL